MCLTETVWNINDPLTVAPTRNVGRPVQVPTGVTCVRRNWAVNVSSRLCVRTVANIGRVAHLVRNIIYEKPIAVYLHL